MGKMNRKSADRSAKKPLPSDKFPQIVQRLLKTGQFLQREMNQVCQRFGLKQQQFSVLNEIVSCGPISQKELCERLLFEKSNVSKIIKILFEKKWIRVTVAADDRRLTLVTETPEGYTVWEECMLVFSQSSSALVSILSKSEQVSVIRLLNKLEKAFKSK